MTVQQSPDAPGPRGRLGLYAPFAGLLVLAAVWSGFWFYASHKAGEAIDAWLAREAAQGRIFACAQKRITGYPFRVELICDGPTARVPGDGGVVVASAPRFLAVAQVYDPRRLIGEVTGPVDVTGPGGVRATLSFALAQASAFADGTRFDRGSLNLTAPRLTVGQTEIGAAETLVAHVRRTPDGTEHAYDLALKIDQGVAPALAFLPVGQGPVTVELQAEARGLDDLRPKPTSERLRAFADAGGEVKVALARLVRGDVAASARGAVRLDTEGRLDGAFDVTARGADGLIRDLVGGGKKDLLASVLGVGATLLGKPATLDDQPARTYPVRLDRGRVSVGPVQVWRAPPLF